MMTSSANRMEVEILFLLQRKEIGGEGRGGEF